MCFYDLDEFSCGHVFWAKFRIFCNTKGERCNVKSAHCIVQKFGKCRTCDGSSQEATDEREDAAPAYEISRQLHLMRSKHGQSWDPSCDPGSLSLCERTNSSNCLPARDVQAWDKPQSIPLSGPKTIRKIIRATAPDGLGISHSRPMSTEARRKDQLARFPLRNLLSKYRVLDAMSQLTPEVINNCLDLVYAEPPSRPLTESLASVYVSTPRCWLIIRRMIRNFYTDVLHVILGILSDALVCTDYVLSHTESQPILTISEQQLACKALFSCIGARRLIIKMLHCKIQAFVVSLTPQGHLKPMDQLTLVSSSAMYAQHKLARTLTDYMTIFPVSLNVLNDPLSRSESEHYSAGDEAGKAIARSPTTVMISRLYRSLLLILNSSKWGMLLDLMPPSSSTTRAINKHVSSGCAACLSNPFPGQWACREGYILWKSELDSGKDLGQAMSFPLHGDPRNRLIELTKMCWTLTHLHRLQSRSDQVPPKKSEKGQDILVSKLIPAHASCLKYLASRKQHTILALPEMPDCPHPTRLAFLSNFKSSGLATYAHRKLSFSSIKKDQLLRRPKDTRITAVAEWDHTLGKAVDAAGMMRNPNFGGSKAYHESWNSDDAMFSEAVQAAISPGIVDIRFIATSTIYLSYAVLIIPALLSGFFDEVSLLADVDSAAFMVICSWSLKEMSTNVARLNQHIDTSIRGQANVAINLWRLAFITALPSDTGILKELSLAQRDLGCVVLSFYFICLVTPRTCQNALKELNRLFPRRTRSEVFECLIVFVICLVLRMTTAMNNVVRWVNAMECAGIIAVILTPSALYLVSEIKFRYYPLTWSPWKFCRIVRNQTFYNMGKSTIRVLSCISEFYYNKVLVRTTSIILGLGFNRSISHSWTFCTRRVISSDDTATGKTRVKWRCVSTLILHPPLLVSKTL